MAQSRYQELSKSLAEARTRFAGYRSECFFFAAQFARGFIDYTGWPRDQVGYEAVGGSPADGPAPEGGRVSSRVEEAMHLDSDGFWHFGLRLTLGDAKAPGSVLVKVRFKKPQVGVPAPYLISLVGFEEHEVAQPTPDALQPIYDAIVNAVKRHYDDGLRLFLENGGRGLKIPIGREQLDLLGKP